MKTWLIWLLLIAAICVSYAIDMLTHSLWGMFAYGPPAVAVAVCWRRIFAEAGR